MYPDTINAILGLYAMITLPIIIYWLSRVRVEVDTGTGGRGGIWRPLPLFHFQEQEANTQTAILERLEGIEEAIRQLIQESATPATPVPALRRRLRKN